jgi:hypothetical protein
VIAREGNEKLRRPILENKTQRSIVPTFKKILGRSGKPVTQILLRICNRESLHKDFITPIYKSVHCPEGSKASPIYPYLFAVECCFEPLVYSHISVPRRAFST